MKLKGINPFEQHVEKIVLGLAIAAVGGVAAWQFLSAPTVRVAGKDVDPGEVDALLESKARKLQTQLRGESNITIPSEGVLLAAPSFDTGITKPIAPASRLAVAAPSFAEALVKAEASSFDVWYYEPSIPAVAMDGPVIQTADALTAASAAEALKISPSLSSHFTSTEGPQDVVWTTPVAKIDLKALRTELARSNPQAKPPRSAIPSVWYESTPFVVDVAFERREEQADGSFGPVQRVPVFTPAETLSYRGRISSASRGLQEEVFATLKDPAEQLQVLQMPFFETVNNAFVSPAVAKSAGAAPTSSSESNDSIRLTLQKKTQLESKKRLAAKLISELAKLGGEYDDAKEKQKEEDKKREERERKEAEKKGTGGGGGGGGGFGMGGGGMKGRNDPTGAGEKADKDAARDLAERKRKTAQLRTVERDIASLEQQLGATPTTNTTAAAKLPSLSTEDEVLVWGHDLEVLPGHKYQYRCVIRVYNPFFARGNQLVKEQDEKGLAQAFVLDSKPSEWSQTVTVSPRVRFFVTRASSGDGPMGMGTAQVEVYRLVDGQWRRSEMQVQPGERIGRVDDRTRTGGKVVDFTTDYYVAAIVEDLEAKNSGERTRRPAFVVVRELASGPEIERRPESDFNDVERIQLREDANNTAAAEARAADTSTPAGGKPGGGSGPGGGTGPGGGPGGGGLTGGGGGTGGGGRDR